MNSCLQSRRDQSRVTQSRKDQSRRDQSRVTLSRRDQSRLTQSRRDQSRRDQSRVTQSRRDQSRVTQSRRDQRLARYQCGNNFTVFIMSSDTMTSTLGRTVSMPHMTENDPGVVFLVDAFELHECLKLLYPPCSNPTSTSIPAISLNPQIRIGNNP